VACLDENAFAEFIEGKLSSEDEHSFDSHVASCRDCRTLLGQYARSLFASVKNEGAAPAPLLVGERVGRYVILSWLGSGAMGVVYRAYDPELDRLVALKLWRGELAGELQEARAMARVAHPNVVHVYETGVFRGRVFMAMEFIDGPTLREWQREGARGWREVVLVYTQAGRGLAAAHAAQIVHRDFKPENVLVLRDGSAKVTDFGLALAGSGRLAGTPAYMAPEQRRGSATPKSDQYGFCVALYEALHGVHPWARRAAPSRRVPAWVNACVARGMQLAPEDRYPTMAALLDALARDPRRQWLRRAAWASPAVALSLSILTPLSAKSRAEKVCSGAEQRLSGVWDAAMKSRASGAFAASKASGADKLFLSAAGELDRYADSWVRMRTEACEATERRHEQSAELMDLRVECLDRKLGDLRAVGDALARADKRTVASALKLAHSLGRIEDCADAKLLRAGAAPPEGLALRAKVDALEGRLSEVRTLQIVGKFKEGYEAAKAVQEEAHALDYAPLEADAAIRAAMFELQFDRHEESIAHLYLALRLTERAKDDSLRAYAATKLVLVLGHYQKKFDEAALAGRFAEAAIERAGGADSLRAELSVSRAAVALARGDLVEARNHCRQTVELRERAFGPDDYRLGNGLSELGLLETRLGDYPAAYEASARSVAILEKSYLADQPIFGIALDMKSDILNHLGRFAEAEACAQRAFGIFQKAEPPMPSDAVHSETLLGIALAGSGRLVPAVEHLEHALRLGEATFGPRGIATAGAQFALARVSADKKRARALAESALATYAGDASRPKQVAEIKDWLTQNR
jgi:tetratricopeptide (TPR) repeat protein